MKRISRILILTTLLNVVFFCIAFADTINIPADYSTIQAGINASTNGDTILVQPGTYIENINYNGKNITVGSLFLTTADTSYISQTVIDGNQNGSVVRFENEEDSTAVLTGFTIKNGYASYGGGIYFYESSPRLTNVTITGNTTYGDGGGIFCWSNSSPSLENVEITNNTADLGGGIYCYDNSSPSLENVTITGNSASSDGGGLYLRGNSSPSLDCITIIHNIAAANGGGIYCYYYSSPILQNVIIKNNFAEYGGGIYCYSSSPSLSNVTISNNIVVVDGGGICCKSNSSLVFSNKSRCNIHSNNTFSSRGFGADIFTIQCEIINVILDTFTVLTPTDYYASPVDNFTFDILHSIQADLINSNVYVSVDGDDSNTGTSADDPFKTIGHALSVIYSDSLNINTIYLSSGTYSDSTNGEIFPIRWSNYVNLTGSVDNATILDANSISGVIRFNYVNCAIIQNILIKNGSADKGGGIYCFKSSPIFQNIIIDHNEAFEYGGGIYCKHNSSPYLDNIVIKNNDAILGGGFYCSDNSSPIMINVIISDNKAYASGGGFYCYNNCTPTMENVVIRNNFSSYGGGVYILDSAPVLHHVIISGNIIECYGGGISCAGYTSPVFENVTIIGNSAERGSGISCNNNSFPSIENSIVANNIGNYGIYVYSNGNSSIAYSNFYNNEGGNFYGVTNDSIGVNVTTNANGDSCDAFNNIQLDPLFVDPTNYDYHLSWINYPIPDSTKSPCIDAGDPNSPPDPDGTIADMGAYYFNQNVSIDDPPEIITSQLIICPNPIGVNNNNLYASFSMHKPGTVKIQLFNIKGQLVSTLLNENKNIGDYTISHAVNELSSGIYFTKLSVDGVGREIKKVVLLR